MANDLTAQLQAHFSSGPAEESISSAGDTYGELCQLIESVTGVDADDIERDKPLADVDLRSLTMIELTVKAEEKFKVRLDEETVLGFSTVGDFVNYVEQHR